MREDTNFERRMVQGCLTSACVVDSGTSCNLSHELPVDQYYLCTSDSTLVRTNTVWSLSALDIPHI